MQHIIEVRDLKKAFGAQTAVNGISFTVEMGSLFAFLGQNGAGKTTTINMIIGLLARDGGEILYNGSPDFAAFKGSIGVVFQNNIFDELLTVEENLLTYGSLYIKPPKTRRERFEKIVELLSLDGFIGQPFKSLSGGQKRKAEIARALFMSPEILFLDEPTTGLDPKTRAEVWGIINKLRNERGMTIFLTTHYMEETATADNVAIIDRGSIIATGSPVKLKSQYAFDRLLITPGNAELLEKQLEEQAIAWRKTADTYVIKTNDTSRSIDLLYRLKENIRFYEMIKGSMDDVFLNAVGERIEESGAAI